VKKVASLKIASANNKREIEHEASYDVTTLQHNMIKTGDNNDISMCLFYEKLISKTIISNKSLVFTPVNYLVRQMPKIAPRVDY
jgi:hypothetical protein